MKYLDGYPELDLLSKALSFSSPSLRVSTRIEAYPCKAIARERKLFRTIEHDLLDNLSLSTSISPPEHHSDLVSSAFGPLDRKDSRKTLWLLIATLNIAFPDHDFSTLSAEEFVKEDSPRIVLASLTSALSHLRASNGQDGPPAMPLNLGMGMSSALDSYHKTYSSSAPSAQRLNSRKAIEHKVQSKATAGQTKGQTKGQQAKAGSSSSDKKAITEKISTPQDDTSKEAEGNQIAQSATDASTSAQKKASEHQPRSKPKVSSTSHSTTTSSSKKKQSPISHTTLINKLRNELDGTYEVPTHPLLRQVLDPIIDLSECDVYSYTPDLDSDPHAYQSEDEEEDDEEEEDDDEEDYERQSDGLDMDLEDDDYYKPAMMRGGDDGMSWDMEGVESTPAPSLPGTPAVGMQAQQSSAFFEGHASPSASQSQNQGQGKRSAQKKRSNAGGASAGSAKRQSRASKAGSSVRGGASSADPSTRTRIVPGSSIFGDSQHRGVPFQYGSLDEYSFNHYQDSQQHQSQGMSSRRSPMLEGMSSNDGTDEDEEDDDDDTDNGGLLWSSNYFFYNRKMKRILFVSVWGRKIGKQFSPSNALLARSAGNPLHAYRRQLNASSSSSAVRSGRDGRVTINLNRPRAGSNLALSSTMPHHDGHDENGSRHAESNASGNSKTSSSNLTNALRANSDTSILSPSFSSQPPIANAASIFKPSSPFPRADNRPTTVPGTPSNLNPHRSGAAADDPQPPVIRDSASFSRTGTPLQSSSAGPSGTGGGSPATSRGSRRVRQQSSGASTPAGKAPRKNSKKGIGSGPKTRASETGNA